MKILYRRTLAVLGSIVFFWLLLTTLVWMQLGDTLLNPRFYVEEFREADVYQFALVDLLGSFLEDARALPASKLPAGLERNPLDAPELDTNEIVASVNRAMPPEWAQEVTEQVLEQVGGYLTGRQDEFALTPRAGTRLKMMLNELQHLLQTGDAYDFAYDEIVDPRIEDYLSNAEIATTFDIPADRVALAVRNTLPPEWTQAQVEGALEELSGYMVGETNKFEIRVAFNDRSEMALNEFKGLLRDIDAYNQISDRMIAAEVEKAVAADLPFHFEEVESDRLVEAAQRIASPAWLKSQIERAIDEAGSYMIGTDDAFQVRVELSDRVEISLEEFQEIMNDYDKNSLPYREFVEPRLIAAMGESLALPFGASISGEEIAWAMRQETSSGWFRLHALVFISDLKPYLTGEASHFESQVSLAEPKRAALDSVTEVAFHRIADQVESVRHCLEGENPTATYRPSDELPTCIASGVDASEVLDQLGINVPATVERSIIGRIPDNAVVGERQFRQSLAQAGADGRLDLLGVSEFAFNAIQSLLNQLLGLEPANQEPARSRDLSPEAQAASNISTFDSFMELVGNDWTYNDRDLRADLSKSEGNPNHRLDEVREALRDGWIFTEADLHRLLRRYALGSGDVAEGTDPVEFLDEVRGFMKDDMVYTEEDFRRHVSKNLGADVVHEMDRVRIILKLINVFWWGIWAVLALLLLGIVLLIAMSWPARAAWAMAILFVSSVLIYVAFSPSFGSLALSGPIYQATGIPDLNQLRLNSYSIDGSVANFENTYQMAYDKLFDVAESAVDSFVVRVSNISRNLAVLGLVGLIAAIAWTPSGTSKLLVWRFSPYGPRPRTGAPSRSVGEQMAQSQRVRQLQERRIVLRVGQHTLFPPTSHGFGMDVETPAYLRPRQVGLFLEPHQPLGEVGGEAVGYSAVANSLSRHRAGPLPGFIIGCPRPVRCGGRARTSMYAALVVFQ